MSDGSEPTKRELLEAAFRRFAIEWDAEALERASEADIGDALFRIVAFLETFGIAFGATPEDRLMAVWFWLRNLPPPQSSGP